MRSGVRFRVVLPAAPSRWHRHGPRLVLVSQARIESRAFCLPRAAGLPAAPSVAEPPRADPDAAALDKLVDLADTLDTVRANYAICTANIGRLSEARNWYEALRARVNRQ